MIHSFTVTFGAKYVTGIVTSVPPYETFSLIKRNIPHQSEYILIDIFLYHITSKMKGTQNISKHL